MVRYTQANRPLRVASVLEDDVLLLAGLRGEETVSSPFAFQLDLLSEDPELEAAKLLRTTMTVSVSLRDGSARTIHGLVNRFVRLGQAEDLTEYRAILVPWFWFLSLSRESRIYQNLTVREIIEEVFAARDFTDFEWRLVHDYSPREYCVQYRESHLAFVSRLLEEEGIFYFFEHSADRHVLVLADHNSAMTGCPGQAYARFHAQEAPDEDVVRAIEEENSVYVGTVTLRDYNYLRPLLNLEASLSGSGVEEVYDYPGRYGELADGERYARIELETEEALRQVLHGHGSCRAFGAGYSFKLTDHFRRDLNGEFLLLRVRHEARVGDYRGQAGDTVDYSNDFLAIPSATPYHAERRTRRPLIHGTQTALVVGPPGEEVWVDQHCRIKVQFYWDRLGKKDESSSCWVRVASPWAGKGYGNITIPRIGNEVVVQFLEGDPDRPLVVASVYNGDQTPPFPLPSSDIQQGMLSRSSPGGGGANQITVTDTAGSELLTLHAQHDMGVSVNHDQSTGVNHNRSVSVQVNDSESVGGNQSVTVGGNRSLSVTGNQSLDVSGNQSVHVTGNRNVSVDADESVQVAGNQGFSVSGDRQGSVSGNNLLQVSSSMGVDVSANLESHANQIAQQSDAAMVLNAGSNLDLKGASKVTVASNGSVEVNAPKILLTGTGEVTLAVGGNSVKVDASGVTLFGVTVKIN